MTTSATNFNTPDYTYRVIKITREVSEEHQSPRVIDGDTVDVLIDLGFFSTIRKRVRLLDIDTDELRGGTDEEKERARAAKLRIEELLSQGDVFVRTNMDAEGKYGRVLGRFFVKTKTQGTMEASSVEVVIDVNKTLKEEGFEKGSALTETVKSWIEKLRKL
jgi:micrococcal nuclease